MRATLGREAFTFNVTRFVPARISTYLLHRILLARAPDCRIAGLPQSGWPASRGERR
jgi:hypothetical protein